jgi:hypothetical protein
VSRGSSLELSQKDNAYAEQKRNSKLLAPSVDAATKVAGYDGLKVLKVV